MAIDIRIESDGTLTDISHLVGKEAPHPNLQHLSGELPSSYFGGEKIPERTSKLIDYTAENVCITCDFSDIDFARGGGIYVICQHPRSLYGSELHNALYGCDLHSNS